MKRLFILFFCISLANLSLAQVTGWGVKPFLPDSPRAGAFYFQINNKFYVGGGSINNTPYMIDDFWEFDAVLNQWSPKSDFAGGIITGAGAFSYNGKGYVIGGRNPISYNNDIWEYDPLLNSWLKKSTSPFTLGGNTLAFVINSKAYITSGAGLLIEYDVLSNSWSSKAPVPGPCNGRQGFSIGSKGYILGDSVSTLPFIYTKLYEYNASTNVWVQKNKPPFNVRLATCLSYGGLGYLIGGNGFSPGPTDYYQKLFKKYDPISDTWSEANTTTFPGAIYSTGSGVIFEYLNRIYYGLGFLQGSSSNQGKLTNSFYQTTFDVSIKEHSINDGSVYLFPQPSADFVELHGLNESINSVEFHFFNSLGKLVKVERVDPYYEGYKLNLSELSTGIYNIHVLLPDSSYFTSLRICKIE